MTGSRWSEKKEEHLGSKTKKKKKTASQEKKLQKLEVDCFFTKYQPFSGHLTPN